MYSPKAITTMRAGSTRTSYVPAQAAPLVSPLVTVSESAASVAGRPPNLLPCPRGSGSRDADCHAVPALVLRSCVYDRTGKAVAAHGMHAWVSLCTCRTESMLQTGKGRGSKVTDLHLPSLQGCTEMTVRAQWTHADMRLRDLAQRTCSRDQQTHCTAEAC